MRETSDINELHPLTDAANFALQDYTRKIKEFATSSRWGASAVAIHMSEGPDGYEVTLGFELDTPLNFPLEDVVKAHAITKEHATTRAVAEWLQLFFKPALRIHFDKSERIRDGQTTVGKKTVHWRMAEGSVMVNSEHLTDAGQMKETLAERSLFDRVDLGDAFRFPPDVPVLCIKLEITRPAGERARTEYECKLNNEDWPEGLELLRRFELPLADSSMQVRQYLFVRPVEQKADVKTGTVVGAAVAAAKPAATVAAKGAAPASGGTAAAGGAGNVGRKSWWKFW